MIRLRLEFSINSHRASFRYLHLLLTLIGEKILRFHKILKPSTRPVTKWYYEIILHKPTKTYRLKIKKKNIVEMHSIFKVKTERNEDPGKNNCIEM